MTWNENEHYRHENALDTDIYVFKVLHATEDYTELLVDFVNQRHTGTCSELEVIKIYKKDYALWSHTP